jgi:hypothetical protein
MPSTIFFEVRETGDEGLPFMVWDRDEETPFSYHADLTDLSMGLARARWAEGQFFKTGRWPG